MPENQPGQELEWVTDVKSLRANADGSFDVTLTDDIMRSFVKVYREANLANEFIFSESLRWFNSIYIFLGGMNFAEAVNAALAKGGHPYQLSVHSEEPQLWDSVEVRRIVIAAAFAVLKKVREQRGRGINLFDPQFRTDVKRYDD